MKTSQKQSRMSRSALRRQREKEQRCQTMLKAAETLFARKGYHQAGMEEIADLAEVSTGAVYFYFKNKEDLLVRLTEDIGFFLREWLGRELEKNKLTIDGFCNIARAFLKDFCVRYPEKITIFFRESAGQSREMEEHRKNGFRTPDRRSGRSPGQGQSKPEKELHLPGRPQGYGYLHRRHLRTNGLPVCPVAG